MRLAVSACVVAARRAGFKPAQFCKKIMLAIEAIAPRLRPYAVVIRGKPISLAALLEGRLSCRRMEKKDGDNPHLW